MRASVQSPARTAPSMSGAARCNTNGSSGQNGITRMETVEVIERLSAWIWLLLAVIGLVIRSRRLWILHQWTYDDPDDQRYLRGVIRSSWLRWGVKFTLLLGGLLAVTQGALAYTVAPGLPIGDLATLFWAWRTCVIVVLILLTIEDLNVEQLRTNLGRGHVRSVNE